MPRYSLPLKAGKAERVPYPGHTFQLVNPGAVSLVGLVVEWGSNVKTEDFGQVEQYFRVFNQSARFTGLEFTAAADTTIDFIVSDHDVDVNRSDGSTVNIAGTVNVDVASGPGTAPGTPLYVNGQVETPAGTVTDDAAVVAGPAALDLLAADATRLEFIAYNQGPDPVALGMVGITWAKRAIVLNAGDTYVEARAAAMRWQVITDAAKTANVTVQERKP